MFPTVKHIFVCLDPCHSQHNLNKAVIVGSDSKTRRFPKLPIDGATIQWAFLLLTIHGVKEATGEGADRASGRNEGHTC
jgi:hypothetical protein